MAEPHKNLSFGKRAKFACAGIASALRSEKSFRFQTLAALAVFPLLLVTRPAAIWWAVLLLTVGCVLSAELINTALEKMVDRLHPEQHPEIGLAKDCAAGAVFVLSLISLAVFAAFVYDLRK